MAIHIAARHSAAVDAPGARAAQLRARTEALTPTSTAPVAGEGSTGRAA